jgi:putative ABC transport system permease protein
MWTLAASEVPSSPVAIDGDPRASRDVQYFQVIGRLGAGVSIDQANADLRAIGDRLGREFPDTNGGEWAEATAYHEVLVGDIRGALLMLLGAVGFVLLIACANVASLLLARGSARRRELALRSALGAPRRRLIRQLLTESVLLAALGGALGLVVAYGGVQALIALAPESIPRLTEVQVDRRVAGFAIAASALVGVLFGIVPALQGARPQVVEALKDGGRTGTARPGVQRMLVVAEVALALVLLIGAGLMLTSFSRLRAVDVGFDPTNLVVVFVPLPQARYDSEAQAQFYTRLIERLRTNPVTERSALVFPTPFGGGNARGGYTVEGAPDRQRSEQPMVQINSITPGYFATMAIPVLRGRDVELSDTRDRPGVIVINQTLAAREWPNQDPVGKRLSIGGGMLTVVGVVADSKRSDLEAAQEPAVYMSHAAFTIPFMGAIVRSELSEGTITSAVREAVLTLDPELPIDNADTVATILERTTGQPRFRALLVTAFAAVALVLAGVGLYGLISYTVAQRVPEIGVRLALGATPAQVGGLVVRQGLFLAAGGVALGMVGALGATRLIEGLLYSVSASDPVIYFALAALLLSIAALACYLPARRAMRVDPMAALRSD